MKAAVVVLGLVVFAVGCGHKRPKEAKSKPQAATATAASAPDSKCEVKGFTYSVPAPGPITDGGGAQ